MLDSGRIALNNLAWHEGLESWQPLDRVLNITPSPLANQPAPASDALPETLSLSSSKPASFGIRFVAHIVDCIIANILAFIPAFVIGFVLGLGGTPSDTIEILGAVVGLLSAWLYYALLESSSKQATIGKMICGIFVTDLQGQRISFGQASGRYFGMIVSAIILCIGFLMCIWTEKKQCLHDMMAGCLVRRK